MFQSPGPLLFQIGSFSLRWYGLLIAVGILLCYWYAVSEAQRRGVSRKPIDDMVLFVILGGVIGARLYYVLFNFSYFMSAPLEIFKVWHGGLAIHGALIGGALVFFSYRFMKKIPWLLYADIIVPGVLLAQGIGRWGNFFNSEAFGGPTSLPWKLFILETNRPAGYEAFSYFHPTFLYESLWNVIGFFLLIHLSRKLFPTKKDNAAASLESTHATHSYYGAIFFAYLVWYSIGRFFIESLRTDSLYWGPLRIAQVMSVILFFVGVFGLLFLHRRHRIKTH